MNSGPADRGAVSGKDPDAARRSDNRRLPDLAVLQKPLTRNRTCSLSDSNHDLNRASDLTSDTANFGTISASASAILIMTGPDFAARVPEKTGSGANEWWLPVRICACLDVHPMIHLPDVLPACAGCGRCCYQVVELVPLTDDVPEELVVEHDGVRCLEQRGDGACMALDLTTQLCTIYERRPQVCRDFRRGEALCRNVLARPRTVRLQSFDRPSS